MYAVFFRRVVVVSLSFLVPVPLLALVKVKSGGVDFAQYSFRLKQSLQWRVWTTKASAQKFTRNGWRG